MHRAQDFYHCFNAATTKEQEANHIFSLYFYNIMSLILSVIVSDDKGCDTKT